MRGAIAGYLAIRHQRANFNSIKHWRISGLACIQTSEFHCSDPLATGIFPVLLGFCQPETDSPTRLAASTERIESPGNAYEWSRKPQRTAPCDCPATRFIPRKSEPRSRGTESQLAACDHDRCPCHICRPLVVARQRMKSRLSGS